MKHITTTYIWNALLFWICSQETFSDRTKVKNWPLLKFVYDLAYMPQESGNDDLDALDALD